MNTTNMKRREKTDMVENFNTNTLFDININILSFLQLTLLNTR